MEENGKYIIDITKEHFDLFNLLLKSGKSFEYIKELFKETIDGIVNHANNLLINPYQMKTIDSLIIDMVNESYGTVVDQNVYDETTLIFNKLADYYVHTINELNITSNILFVDEINKRGVYINTYSTRNNPKEIYNGL